nr:hypothetical protein [Tanacetum cinerariifolium]
MRSSSKKYLPPKENDLGSFILPCSIGRLDFNNTLADQGTSISIMPFSMFKCLGIRILEPIDMVIKVTDDTKCIPKGIVKNLLIKIDKFILLVDFVILDMIEDFMMPVISGRPLLAIAYAKVDIFRKTISLEFGNEKVISKMRNVQESFEEIVYRCSLITQEANRGLSEEFEDPDGYGESKENIILETIINKLHDEWFKGTHEDNDDLEGIIDYLEQTLYDGFIDLDDEEYKERKCKLLGMPYIKPPLILIENIEVTRYSAGPGDVYTKINVSKTEELSRTRGNIANIRARIMEEILINDDEKESYDKT